MAYKNKLVKRRPTNLQIITNLTNNIILVILVLIRTIRRPIYILSNFIQKEKGQPFLKKVAPQIGD